jgi:autotransporter-associated beta strand protein
MLVPRRFAVAIGIGGWRQIVKPSIIIGCAIVLAVALDNSQSLAVSGTWSSTAATGTWSTTSNWVSGNVPGATSGTSNTDTATFNSSSSTLLVVPDALRNLEFIAFDTSGAAYTIGTTGGNALLLTAGGELQIASKFTGANITETINAPVTLEGNYTFADNSSVAGDLLDFEGTITSGVVGLHTLTIAGNDNTTVGGAIAGANTISLVKSGNGTLALGGNNTFTGGVTINAGTVLVANSAALNSSAPNAVVFGAASTGVLSLNGRSISLSGLATNASPGTPFVQNASAAAAILTINNSAANTFAGNLVDGTGGGALSLVKNGGGTLTLSGQNTYSGGTTVGGGTLVSATTGSLGTGPLTLNAGNLRVSAVGTSVAVNNFGGNGTGWTVNSSGITGTPITNNVLTLTDGNNNEARSAFFNTPQPFAIGAAGFTVTFTYQAGGTLGADGITFMLQNDPRGATALGGGGGSLGLNGISPSAAFEINIYSGHTIGTNFVTDGSVGNYNGTSPVNVNSGDPINVTLSYDPVHNVINEMLADPVAGATFPTSYSNINLAATLGAGTAYIGLSGATGGANSTQTISNFSYSVQASTPGVYGNAVIVPGGASSTVDVGPTAANPTVSMGALSVGAGSSSTLNVVASTAAANQAYGLSLGNAALSSNLLLNVANNTNGGGNAVGTLSLGAVSDGGGGFGISVAGNGVVVLRSANSYTGTTTISGGTLRLADGSSNNIANSPLVNIGAAGNLDVTGLAGSNLVLGSGTKAQTLQGSGLLTGNLTVNAGSTLAGASDATLSITGGVNLQNSSISSFALGPPNGSEDFLTALVNVGGGLSVAGTNTINFSGTAQLGTYELYAFTSAAPPINQFSIGTLPLGHFHFALSTALGDELDLIVSNPVGSAAWNFNGTGNYSDVSKWDLNQIPNGAGLAATFGNGSSNSVNTPSATVTVDGAYTVGTLTLNNTNGTSYILGSDGVAGHVLTLDNNGSGANVNVTAGNQAIFSGLTLADATTFNIASGSSLLLSIGNVGESGGSQSLIKIGGGTLTIDVPSGYTGTTTIAAGTLQTTATGTIGMGPLFVNTAGGVNSLLSLNNDQTVSSLGGTVAGGGTARVAVVSGTTLTVAQSGNTTFAGTLALSGAAAALSKSGNGALELDGAPTFAAGSSISISGGTLRFNVSSGAATVGAGVTATVSGGATLELAGTISALSQPSGGRVNVVNNSTALAGLHVTGPNQQVGGVDGAGTTQVEAGASLTANHFVQTSLLIGGNATTRGLVTIAASDASGNPLASSSGLALAGSIASGGAGSALGFPSPGPSSVSASGLTSGTGPGSPIAASVLNLGRRTAAVPEPSTLLIAAAGVVALGLLGRGGAWRRGERPAHAP